MSDPLDNATTTTKVVTDEPPRVGPVTEYVVLSRDDSGYWSNAGTWEARSAEGAIRALKKEGTYVAVPQRSWKPVTVQAVQTTVLKLEEAK